MARIRTIKPEFFRHEGLQDLEIANPGAYAMLVFAGLWGHCDKAGRFEWKPRTLKLDILPFLPFEMEKTLVLLRDAGFVRCYEVAGKLYGEILSFEKHQRINGKEAQEPEKHPAPVDCCPVLHPGSGGEATGKQQGRSGEDPGQFMGQTAHQPGNLPAPSAESTLAAGFSANPSSDKASEQGSNREATGKQSRSQEGKGREEEREEEGKGELPAPPSDDASAKKTEIVAKETALQAACRETFKEYQRAYADRYGAPHVDNAKVRSQIKQFVQRIGFDESPAVAAWFVRHPGAKYVGAMHGVGLLLADAEKIRTEWVTGRTVTSTVAKQSDRRGAMASAVSNLLAECGGDA